jgi:hypothetical protein
MKNRQPLQALHFVRKEREELAVSWKGEKAKGREKIECGEETCLCAIEKAS